MLAALKYHSPPLQWPGCHDSRIDQAVTLCRMPRSGNDYPTMEGWSILSYGQDRNKQWFRVDVHKDGRTDCLVGDHIRVIKVITKGLYISRSLP